VESAYLCNLLEHTEGELEVKNGQITIPVKPYEIITLKLALR
jgi:alpha-mannosidase